MDKKYFPGFEWLRAVMAISVVAWHTHLFGTSSIFNLQSFKNHTITFSDMMNFHFLLLAVPVFYLISVFLFIMKVDQEPKYFLNRISKLASLYILWGGIWYLVVTGGTLGTKPFSSLLSGAIFFVAAGNSIFYFFFSQMILIVIAYFTRRFSKNMQWLLLILSLAIVFLLPIGARIINSPLKIFLAAFYNPLNFLPYIFIATLVAKEIKSNNIIFYKRSYFILLGFLMSLMIAVLLYEWEFLPHRMNFPFNGYAIPPYARLSVVIGASILFLISFNIKKISPSIVRFLSVNSLGIYCLHPFIMLSYKDVFGFSIDSVGYNISKFLFVLIYSILITVLLRRILKKGVV